MNTDLFTHARDVAQATPAKVYDGIADRDAYLRRELERGSEMLLRAMIRELQSMGIGNG